MGGEEASATRKRGKNLNKSLDDTEKVDLGEGQSTKKQMGDLVRGKARRRVGERAGLLQGAVKESWRAGGIKLWGKAEEGFL